MNSLENKFKNFSISAKDSKSKRSETTQLTSKPSQRTSLTIWKPLPRLHSRSNSSASPRMQASMREADGPSQERSTKSTFLNSKSIKWMPLKRLRPSPKEQIACAQLAEQQQIFTKNSNTLQKWVGQRMTCVTSLSGSDASPCTTSERAKSWTKMPSDIILYKKEQSTKKKYVDILFILQK
ncbi:unnamed protein product [Rhizopus microsporus]